MSFADLKKNRYVCLTTFRKNGQSVATPMWFAVVGDELVLRTGRGSGKARRIRNNPEVTVAPSSGAGHPTGPARSARAEIVDDPAAQEAIEAALARKYGLQKRIVDLALRLARPAHRERLYLRLRQPGS